MSAPKALLSADVLLFIAIIKAFTKCDPVNLADKLRRAHAGAKALRELGNVKFKADRSRFLRKQRRKISVVKKSTAAYKLSFCSVKLFEYLKA